MGRWAAGGSARSVCRSRSACGEQRPRKAIARPGSTRPEGGCGLGRSWRSRRRVPAGGRPTRWLGRGFSAGAPSGCTRRCAATARHAYIPPGQVSCPRIGIRSLPRGDSVRCEGGADPAAARRAGSNRLPPAGDFCPSPSKARCAVVRGEAGSAPPAGATPPAAPPRRSPWRREREPSPS